MCYNSVSSFIYVELTVISYVFSYHVCIFFDTAPSFEAWETHRYLKNRLGIVRAHPYAPCHPPSVPPTEEHLVGHLTNYCHQMSSCGLYLLFLYCYHIEYHMSLVSVLTSADLYNHYCIVYVLAIRQTDTLKYFAPKCYIPFSVQTHSAIPNDIIMYNTVHAVHTNLIE